MSTLKETEKDRIAIKINKLILKAESAKELGSIEEYEIFIQKANSLIIEYNIEMSKIENLNIKDKFSKFKQGNHINYKSRFGNAWVIKLAHVLKSYNFVDFTYNNVHIIFHGDIINVDNVEWIFNHLRIALESLTIKKWKEHLFNLKNDLDYKSKSGISNITYRNFGKSYCYGLVNGIHNKLEDIKKKSDLCKEITDLAISNANALNEYINLEIPGIKEAKPRPVSIFGELYKDGTIDGENVSINRPLSNGESIIKSKMLK